MAEAQNGLECRDALLPQPAAWGEPLRLRFVGTSRKGQLIQLNASRITIGSAPHCGLRLRLQGVRPLQCLIVRGPQGAVARSLSVDTLLNGNRFREEPLSVGDRLQLGPVEFVVDADGRPCLPTPAPTQRDTTTTKPSSRDFQMNPEAATWLQCQPLSAAELLGRLERLEQHLGQAVAVSAVAADSLSAPPTACGLPDIVEPPSVASEPPSLPPAPATPAVDPSRLAELEQAIAELRGQLLQTSDRCQRAEDELAAVATQRDQLLDRLQALSGQLQTTEERLHGLQEAAESQRAQDANVSQAANAEWNRKLADAAAKMQQIQQEFTSRTERWKVVEQQKQQLEDQLRQQLQERAELEKQLAVQAAELATTRDQCESLKQELAEARHPATQPVAEATTPAPETVDSEAPVVEVAAVQAASPQPLPELSWLASRFQAAENGKVPEDPQPVVAESSASPSMVAEPLPLTSEAGFQLAREASVVSTPEFATRQSSLFTAKFLADLEREQAAASADLPGTETLAADTTVAEVIVAQPPVESGTTVEDQPVEMGNSEGAEIAPEESTEKDTDDPVFSDALARLARAGIWKADSQTEPANDEGVADPEAEVREAGVVASRPDRDPEVEEPHSPEPPQRLGGLVAERPREHGAASHGTAHHGAGEEDSIELYMQQLLQRMRGDTEVVKAKPSGATRVVAEADVVEEDVGRPAPLVDEPTVLSQEEYQPRSAAPEANVNLQAMRQLANDNRQKHILTHAQRTWEARSRNKLIGSAAGIATAIAAFFYLDTHTLPAVGALLCGLGIAGYWIWQAYQFRRQLFDSLRLAPPDEIDPRDGAAE